MTDLSQRGRCATVQRDCTASFSLWFRLGAAIAVLSCAACLVPQSVDPITNRQHKPPRIQLESIPGYLLTPVLPLYRQGSGDIADGCHCKLDISIPFVEEDDPSVDLVARWFIDYDVSDARSTAVVQSVPLKGDLNSFATARGPVRFEGDALGTVASGLHVVEVVIAEPDAFIGNSASLPNRAIKTSEGYESAVYRFLIEVKADQDPAVPRCKGNPPSVHVCL